MARYEVAIATSLAFGDQLWGDDDPPLAQFAVDFDGRRFVWHQPYDSGTALCPVVSVMVKLVVNRLTRHELIEHICRSLEFERSRGRSLSL